MLVHALISNRVDYCNSILHRVAAVHLRPFQSVLTASVLYSLHWLPVRRRIEFNTATLCFKAVKLGNPLT